MYRCFYDNIKCLQLDILYIHVKNKPLNSYSKEQKDLEANLQRLGGAVLPRL